MTKRRTVLAQISIEVAKIVDTITPSDVLWSTTIGPPSLCMVWTRWGDRSAMLWHLPWHGTTNYHRRGQKEVHQYPVMTIVSFESSPSISTPIRVKKPTPKSYLRCSGYMQKRQRPQNCKLSRPGSIYFDLIRFTLGQTSSHCWRFELHWPMTRDMTACLPNIAHALRT